MRLGFCAVELAPSPKVQLQATIVPSLSLLPSVKLQVRSSQLLLNAAVGGVFPVPVTLTDWVTVSDSPWSSVTVSVTVRTDTD